jgi:hypothetical protein
MNTLWPTVRLGRFPPHRGESAYFFNKRKTMKLIAHQTPTQQEKAVINMYELQHLGVFKISTMLGVGITIISDIVDKWCDDPNNSTKEETTMSNGNKLKNKVERDSTMAKLRNGQVCYSHNMDDVRGLLGEIMEGEALIVYPQSHNKDKVNIRLGDYAI